MTLPWASDLFLCVPQFHSCGFGSHPPAEGNDLQMTFTQPFSGVFIHKPHGPVVQSVLASSYAVRADNIGNFLHFSCVLCRWSHTEMAKALWPIPFKTLNVAFLRQIWHQIFSMWFRWTLFIINSECENCQSGIEMPHWQASVKAGFVLSSSPSSLCVNAD